MVGSPSTIEDARPFKRLRRLIVPSSLHPTLPPLASKGKDIHEELAFPSVRATYSGRDRFLLGTRSSGSGIFIHLSSSPMDFTYEQCGELLGYLGSEADMAA